MNTQRTVFIYMCKHRELAKAVPIKASVSGQIEHQLLPDLHRCCQILIDV